jgi:DNA phosphorothioation-associated putative methyltransferase
VLDNKQEISNLEIERYRAAIKRNDLSRPVRLAISSGVLEKENTFFDYGCGHGEDVKFLNKQGFQTNGWDPHYFPKNELQKADVVNLGYVLNVIENEQERSEALKNAWNLAGKLLIVSA